MAQRARERSQIIARSADPAEFLGHTQCENFVRLEFGIFLGDKRIVLVMRGDTIRELWANLVGKRRPTAFGQSVHSTLPRWWRLIHAIDGGRCKFYFAGAAFSGTTSHFPRTSREITQSAPGSDRVMCCFMPLNEK